ncbi:hypothetical protein GYH30_050601 [Glycine max]|nr:hypothetical protein GYH30_050601 [Glycine max]
MAEKIEELTESSFDVEGLVVKRIERVAMKRRENMAEMKIRTENKLQKLEPPLPPLATTAIGY